jgi:hypothetical protein
MLLNPFESILCAHKTRPAQTTVAELNALCESRRAQLVAEQTQARSITTNCEYSESWPHFSNSFQNFSGRLSAMFLLNIKSDV